MLDKGQGAGLQHQKSSVQSRPILRLPILAHEGRRVGTLDLICYVTGFFSKHRNGKTEHFFLIHRDDRSLDSSRASNVVQN
jgi:hypothetical protein